MVHLSSTNVIILNQTFNLLFNKKRLHSSESFGSFFSLFSEMYTTEFVLTGVLRQEKNFAQFQLEVQR